MGYFNVIFFDVNFDVRDSIQSSCQIKLIMCSNDVSCASDSKDAIRSSSNEH